jgi:hypothetical protein
MLSNPLPAVDNILRSIFRSSLFVILLGVLGVPIVGAQTLKHDFQREGEEYTVYLRIEDQWIETWRVGEEGNCMMYPSSVQYEDDKIRFREGTEWMVERVDEETMDITFPKGRTVTYEETQRDPAAVCDDTNDAKGDET